MDSVCVCVCVCVCACGWIRGVRETNRGTEQQCEDTLFALSGYINITTCKCPHTQSTYNLLIKKKSSWTGSNTKDLNWLRHTTETLQIYSTTRGKYLRTAGGGFTELMWSGIPVHFLSEMSQMEESRMLSTSTLTKVSLQSRLLDIKSTAFIKSELTQMAGLPNTQTITHTLSPFNTYR